jgi:hypothetical protein
VHVPTGDPTVCGRDIALIALREPLTPDEATPIAPRLDLSVEDQEVYSAIGYGTSAEDIDDAGIRRRRDALAVACVGPSCGSSEHVDGREWRGDHGVCDGDSGGPGLDAEGTLIGVTSRGPLGCDDPIYGGVTAWKGWIRERAADAARAGSYPPPWWVDQAAVGGPASKRELPKEEWSSCATAAPASSARRGASGALVAAALGLAAALRRRIGRRASRRSSSR